MRVVIIGQKYFGAAVLALAGERAAAVIAPGRDDRLARAAAERGLPAYDLTETPLDRLTLPGRYDLLIAAHAHWLVPTELRQQFVWSIGYHPSLLPLYRGRSAIEATIAAGDQVTGGTVYHLNDKFDAGAVAFQDWCFVGPDNDPTSLWQRRLAPLGLKLLALAVRHLEAHGSLPIRPQEILEGRKGRLEGVSVTK